MTSTSVGGPQAAARERQDLAALRSRPSARRLPPFHWWRTVFFLIPTIAVYTIALGTLSIASSLVDRRGVAGHWCARAWAWLILATTGVEVRASGCRRLDATRTYVFASNHQSIYDIPVIFASLPFQLRILAKESLGRFPVLGWHLKRTGHLLVDRRKPGATLFRQIAARMKTGVSLIVFPEGTRSADGRVARFKGGVFLLAIEAGVPIVPVSVSASRHVMRKGRLLTRPGHVRLVVHDPVPTAGLTAADAKALASRVREIVRSAVEEDPPASADRGADVRQNRR